MRIKKLKLLGEFLHFNKIITIFFILLLFPAITLAENPEYVVSDISKCFSNEYPGDSYFAPDKQKLFSNHSDAHYWYLQIKGLKSKNPDDYHIETRAIPITKGNWFYSYIQLKNPNEYYYGVWPANPACVKPWTNTNIHVTLNNKDVVDAQISLFSDTGTDLGNVQRTDKTGQASLSIPEGAYKFRVDSSGTQYWSNEIHILPEGQTQVNLALDILASDNTNIPAQNRFDGTPPEKEPYMLASLVTFTGILNQSVIAATGQDKIYWYINDHLGTPQKIVDENQTVVWEATQVPFGDLSISNASIDNSFRFPGQIFDIESGLHYNYFRYYDPAIGRYINPDPIGLTGGINLFAYADHNPINAIDMFGLDSFRQNRILGPLDVEPYGDAIRGYVSHTYIYTTNPDGSLKHTYSWGNDYDEQNRGLWFKDQRPDIRAAEQAINNPTLLRGDKVGDWILDYYIEAVFSAWQNDENHPSRHKWSLINNCKNEADSLTEEAATLMQTVNILF